jgi:protein TonB
VRAKPNVPQSQSFESGELGSLRACLVEGDASQRARERRLRSRSLLLSVIVQIVILSALILAPILSRTERIALANVMPIPPYRPAVTDRHVQQAPHHASTPHTFSFCLDCPPLVAHIPAHDESSVVGDELIGSETGTGIPVNCPDCAGLLPNQNPQPIVPGAPAPSMIRLGHLDPAMLIHRVDPVFPTLARQAGREGHVELHAIIATDGSVRSLQFIEGDPLFSQSALDAVRQWRYKPTLLNGRPVEVDTQITVIYRLNR